MITIHHEPSEGRWAQLPEDYVLPGGITRKQIWLLVFEDGEQFASSLRSGFIERLIRGSYSVEYVTIGWKRIAIIQKQEVALSKEYWESFFRLLESGWKKDG